MPDRNPHDESQEHPPLIYHGEERRKNPGLGTTIHTAVAAGTAAGAAAAHANEPEWQKNWPNWAKLLWHMGPFSLICLALLGLGTWMVRETSAERNYVRQDRLEEREIRRAEQAQHIRHNDVLAGELRAVGQKFDAMGQKLESVLMEQRSINQEIRASSRILDRLSKELQVMIDRLAKIKIDVPTVIDILEHVPPFDVWMGPPKVRPEPLPHPRPCDAHSHPTTRTGPPASGAWQCPVTVSGTGEGMAWSNTSTTTGGSDASRRQPSRLASMAWVPSVSTRTSRPA